MLLSKELEQANYFNAELMDQIDALRTTISKKCEEIEAMQTGLDEVEA